MWTHAWTFDDGGATLVECLLHGRAGRAQGVWLRPRIVYNASAGHHEAWLPFANLLDSGVYDVRCVRLYERGIARPMVTDVYYRWPNRNRGPRMAGGKRGLVLPVLQKTSVTGAGSAYAGRERVLPGTPAVVTVRATGAGQHRRHTAPCTGAVGSQPGRWVPRVAAQEMVINSAAIPSKVRHYWVPFKCTPTHWTLDLLQQIAARPAAPGRNANGAQEYNVPACNLDRLSRVMFTGRSTASLLFHGLLTQVLQADSPDATRNKTREHEREDAGLTALDAWSFVLGPRQRVEMSVVSTEGAVLPGGRRPNRTRSMVRSENRHALWREVISKSPSAVVLHIGLHELCGAYGGTTGPSGWDGVCYSRDDLLNTYADYATELRKAGLENVTLFRTVMGGYVDATGGTSRWGAFASQALPRTAENHNNKCTDVFTPMAAVHAAESATAWAQSGFGVLDAYNIFASSPDLVEAMRGTDGMHPSQQSVEVLAVNQMAMNGLCAM